jgi:hypothetical protein
MGDPLNLNALIPNCAMTMVFLRGRNVRSPGWIEVMFQKMRKMLYGNCSRHIMSFRLNMKNVKKGIPFLPQGGPFEGSNMHSTSSMFDFVFHHSIGLGSSHQMNGTPSKNCIPLQKPWRATIE